MLDFWEPYINKPRIYVFCGCMGLYPLVGILPTSYTKNGVCIVVIV